MYTLEELKKMKPEQLNRTLREARMNLARTRFESRTGQTKNHHKVKSNKHLVAQILTVLNQTDNISRPKKS